MCLCAVVRIMQDVGILQKYCGVIPTLLVAFWEFHTYMDFVMDYLKDCATGNSPIN